MLGVCKGTAGQELLLHKRVCRNWVCFYRRHPKGPVCASCPVGSKSSGANLAAGGQGGSLGTLSAGRAAPLCWWDISTSTLWRSPHWFFCSGRGALGQWCSETNKHFPLERCILYYICCTILSFLCCDTIVTANDGIPKSSTGCYDIAKSSCYFGCLLYACTMFTQKSMYMTVFYNKVFIRESWLEFSFFQCSWSHRRMQVEVFSYAPVVWLELRPEIQLWKSFPKYYCSIYDIYICACIVYTRVCKIL